MLRTTKSTACIVDIGRYQVSVEVEYSVSPVRPASMSGPVEGGIELEGFEVLSALDDDGEEIDDLDPIYRLIEASPDCDRQMAEAVAQFERRGVG